MPVKVSKIRFLNAIKNNEEGLTDKELAIQLGITPDWFCTLKKRYSDDICVMAREIAREYAMHGVNDLRRQSRKNKTEATKTILEISGTYTPKKHIGIGSESGSVYFEKDKEVGEPVDYDLDEHDKEK